MKRYLALVLSLVMLCGAFPVTAGAAGRHPFVDVPDNHWADDAVQYVYDNGLMNGMSPTTFEPDKTFSRAMFVTILGRLEGIDTSKYTGMPFWDVAGPRLAWAAPYIQWASQNGIVNGYGGGQFGPDDTILREQYCAIICRYMKATGNDFPGWAPRQTVVADAGAISAYAVGNVLTLVNYGLADLDGMTFEPKKALTRGEIADLFSRFHKLQVKDELPDLLNAREKESQDVGDVISALWETSVFTEQWIYGSAYTDKADVKWLTHDKLGTTAAHERVLYPEIYSEMDFVYMASYQYALDTVLSLTEGKSWSEQEGDVLYVSRTDGVDTAAADFATVKIKKVNATEYRLTVERFAEGESLDTSIIRYVCENGYWVFLDPVPVGLYDIDIEII